MGSAWLTSIDVSSLDKKGVNSMKFSSLAVAIKYYHKKGYSIKKIMKITGVTNRDMFFIVKNWK